MLGTGVDVWMNLQATYNRKILEIEREKTLDDQIETASMIDYSYFVKVAGLPDTKAIHERILNLCMYFTVSDLRILMEHDFLVNYRTGISNIQPKNIVNSRAWLQTAINFSKDIETKPFDREKLKENIPLLRGMTLKKPEEFIPQMKTIFSECGVAFVILPNLKNSGINGAVKWINNNRALLAMNDRGADADKFWFSFFHEIGHIIQQKIKTVFVQSSLAEMTDMDSKYEEEADCFASNILIPKADYRRFSPTVDTSEKEIREFASSIGIHPGIVVGRLQHERIIPQNRFASLKEKYKIISGE